jgi:mRNA interferase RelE/StbE
MANYQLFIERAVFKQLKKVPPENYDKIMEAIADLANNPRPHGYIKLKGRPAYRIRQGKYRVIYEINDNILTVKVIDAGDRKKIYE